MGMWEAVVLIVAIVVIGKVMRGGRWNRETRRWEMHSPGNPYARQAMVDEIPALRKDLARLNERVATLEKLATDPSLHLASEIDRLRIEPKPGSAARIAPDA